MKDLCKDIVVLKPDKGSGVSGIYAIDYDEFLINLFSDTTKFERFGADPTNTRLSTLQSYL